MNEALHQQRNLTLQQRFTINSLQMQQTANRGGQAGTAQQDVQSQPNTALQEKLARLKRRQQANPNENPAGPVHTTG